MRSLIAGTGSYAPDKILTNADLEKLVETNDEWIRTRTGIRERHIAAPEQATSDLALIAAQRALEQAGLAAADVEAIIVGTVTPDYPFPSTAAVIQGKLGNKKAFAFDVSAACAGSMYALAVADRYVASGAVKNALVIGADTLTRISNWKDRNTCILFGDGAGAMVLKPTDDPRRGLSTIKLHADGSQVGVLYQPGGGSRDPITPEMAAAGRQYIFMKGQEVYKFAVRALQESCLEVMAAEGLTPEGVTHVIAHQANKRILDATLDRLGIPASKCWMNLEKYGNTSAASVPMTLDEANRAGWFKPGDVILMMAIGGGMAWGASILRW
jgi:3-oxoacyl-[acyl-carrier-protein] synthase III